MYIHIHIQQVHWPDYKLQCNYNSNKIFTPIQFSEIRKKETLVNISFGRSWLLVHYLKSTLRKQDKCISIKAWRADAGNANEIPASQEKIIQNTSSLFWNHLHTISVSVNTQIPNQTIATPTKRKNKFLKLLHYRNQHVENVYKSKMLLFFVSPKKVLLVTELRRIDAHINTPCRYCC